MKAKRQRKLFRLVKEDNLPKLKSYIKKYGLDIRTVKEDDFENTLLHVACACGYDVMASYLLKRGADPLLCNKSGSLPIHLACEYAQGQKAFRHAYTDLVLPLLKVCPSSLDVQNARGVTPRQMLGDIKHRLLSQDSVSDASSDSVESDSALEEKQWNDRLEEEMKDEYSENFGVYDEDYLFEGKKPDTYDNWAESISKEYKKKHHSASQNYQFTRKRQGNDEQYGTSSSKRPKISEERKREFAKKFQEEYAKMKEVEKMQSLEDAMETKKNYDEKCKHVFNGSTSDKKLRFSDIPWPHKKGGDLSSVCEFLFSGLDRRSKTFKRYLREQQIRWHPDRFQQKCGDRVKEGDQEKVMQKVKEISQLLNSLSDEVE